MSWFILVSIFYSLPCCLQELFGNNVEIIMREEVGVACLGQNNSRKDIREEALLDAKKQAVKNAVMEIKSEQKIINGILVIDLIEAYTNAKVIIKNILKEESFIEENKAFKDECYRVRVLAKIIPKDYNEFKLNSLDKKKYPGKIIIDECTFHNCSDWLFTFDECNPYNHWRIPTSKEYKELYELYHVKHINKHRVFWTSDKINDNSNKAVAFNLEKGRFNAYKNKRFYILYICDK